MGQPVRDFRERLAFSHDGKTEDFWDEVYAKAFPKMVSHHVNDGNNIGQRLGVDRWVLLSNGSYLRIDEKSREIRFEDHGDIGIEYEHRWKVGARVDPGWIKKDLTIDYLAYGWIPSGKAIMLPWPQLQRAWADTGDSWLKTYPCRKSENNQFFTWSVYVPFNDLARAIHKAMVVDQVIPF